MIGSLFRFLSSSVHCVSGQPKMITPYCSHARGHVSRYSFRFSIIRLVCYKSHDTHARASGRTNNIGRASPVSFVSTQYGDGGCCRALAGDARRRWIDDVRLSPMPRLGISVTYFFDLCVRKESTPTGVVLDSNNSRRGKFGAHTLFKYKCV